MDEKKLRRAEAKKVKGERAENWGFRY